MKKVEYVVKRKHDEWDGISYLSKVEFDSTIDASVLSNEEDLKLNITEGFQVEEKENEESSMGNKR